VNGEDRFSKKERGGGAKSWRPNHLARRFLLHLGEKQHRKTEKRGNVLSGEEVSLKKNMQREKALLTKGTARGSKDNQRIQERGGAGQYGNYVEILSVEA